MEMGADSDNYSDEFYSDDFDDDEGDEDRADGGSVFDSTVQRQGKVGGLQDVVNQYAQVLGSMDAGGSASQSFLNQ